jgi:hypothetical protein
VTSDHGVLALELDDLEERPGRRDRRSSRRACATELRGPCTAGKQTSLRSMDELLAGQWISPGSARTAATPPDDFVDEDTIAG